ncbi:hypothetical protein ACSSS7_007822 [Eimeria intestinalis]
MDQVLPTSLLGVQQQTQQQQQQQQGPDPPRGSSSSSSSSSGWLTPEGVAMNPPWAGTAATAAAAAAAEAPSSSLSPARVVGWGAAARSICGWTN